MKALLDIDPGASEVPGWLERTTPGEPTPWRPNLEEDRVVELETEDLEIDGIRAHIVRYPWGPRLGTRPEDNCRWGPHVDYMGTVLSMILVNGRIFDRRVYEKVIVEGGCGDQGFGCWLVEELDEIPGARETIAAWEAHHGRAFDDELIVMWPSWAGDPAPSCVPRRTLRTFLRIGVWLYFDSPRAPWLFRPEPLIGTTKLAPDDPEQAHLTPPEAALRRGEAVADEQLARLGLRDATLWRSKLLHLTAHRAHFLAGAYWRHLAAREPSPVEGQAPFLFSRALEVPSAVADELKRFERDLETSYLDGSGLHVATLIPEKRAALRALRLRRLRRRFDAVVRLDEDLRALGRAELSEESLVRPEWGDRSELPDNPPARRRILAAALEAFVAMPEPPRSNRFPDERSFEFRVDGERWTGFFDRFTTSDVTFRYRRELQMTRVAPGTGD